MSDEEDEAPAAPKNFIMSLLGDVGKSDTTQQLLIGAGSGWVSGFLALRVARTAAFAVGGGIILLQIASDRELIKINWRKIDKKKKKVSERVESELRNQTWSGVVVDFLKNNTPFSAGFFGGFMIGIAS